MIGLIVQAVLMQIPYVPSQLLNLRCEAHEVDCTYRYAFAQARFQSSVYDICYRCN